MSCLAEWRAKPGGEFAGPELVDGQAIMVWSWKKLLFVCQAANDVVASYFTLSEGEVAGDEVFRAPGWSAGFLHLHFSVARSVPVGWRRRVAMIQHSSDRPHVERRSANRVSSAVWPASIRRVVATGKAAQRRRDWLMQRRWLVLLVDALSLRVIFILTTLLVVASSLLVAVLGLAFWYLLLMPLLLFAMMLLAPIFLVSKAPMEAPPASLSAFAQEFKSSMGFLSLSTQELQSNPGYFQELPNSSAHLSVNSETPATPMPTEEPPLVRVLETYDLRETRVRHFFEEMLRRETGEHSAIRQHLSRDFWNSAVCPTTLNARTSSLENENTPDSNTTERLPPPNEQP